MGDPAGSIRAERGLEFLSQAYPVLVPLETKRAWSLSDRHWSQEKTDFPGGPLMLRQPSGSIVRSWPGKGLSAGMLESCISDAGIFPPPSLSICQCQVCIRLADTYSFRVLICHIGPQFPCMHPRLGLACPWSVQPQAPNHVLPACGCWTTLDCAS